MKKLCMALLLTLMGGAAMATNYYIDSQTGKDGNAGTSPAKAWRSLEKVSATTFAPGDSILFRRGSVWAAYDAVRPQGSGVKGRPIVISAYGEGARPLIAGQGFVGGGVISLKNQSHWVISNLELTNWADEAGDRRGVEVKGANAGLLQGIHILDMEIHHIKGIVGQGRKEKRTAGVEFLVTHDKTKATRYDDLRVERCHIHHIENQGIVLNNEVFETTYYPGDAKWQQSMFTNVVIRDNVIHHISKNAMIIRMTEGGVVEHNTCFCTSTMEHGGNTIFSRNVRGTLFQYNEGFRNRSPHHDGSFYDPDLNSPGSIWRYSYSHDNAHGLVWFCTGAPDDGIKVYDNVSENDHGYLVYFNYRFKEADVYRNLFYAGPTVRPFFYRVNRKNQHERFSLTYNVVYNESPSMRYESPYKGPMAEGSKEEIGDNLFLGKPLKENPASGNVELKAFKRFHRGFLRTTPLDSLVGNSVELFEPQPCNDAIVGRVNGAPVYRFELERELAACRWMFATKRGKKAREACYEEALKRVVLMKVKLEAMASRNMLEAKTALDIERLRAKENAFRQATDKEQVMWFGPHCFESEPFWEFFYADAQEALRKRLGKAVLRAKMADLRRHFDEMQQPSWLKYGFDYDIRPIRASLLDKDYDAYFSKKAAEAVVKMDEAAVKTYLN